ncbi:MAG: hypothetical protein IT458_05630 [Planctomycetes bacterium]|nr:hypothetical protein [Planctomycetota bacterium]
MFAEALLVALLPASPRLPDSSASPLPACLPDDGYDLCVLDVADRAVLGDRLALTVRARPANPYAVFVGPARRVAYYRGVPLHLEFAAGAVLLLQGVVPPDGAAPHALPIPAVAGLENVTLHFQAFTEDAGVVNRIAASDHKQTLLLKDLGQPVISLLTVNQIPRDQNGAEFDEGTVQVPPTGFTIDLYFDPRGRGVIDPNTLVVTADQPLGGGAVAPGTNLAPYFTFANGSTAASATVAAGWAFPANTRVVLKADVKNAAGVAAEQASHAVRCVNFTQFTRPFVTRQLWHLDFDTHDLDRNGVKDFREDLVLFGLGNSAQDPAGASFQANEWARRAVQARLRANYGVGGPDAVNVDFLLAPPGSIHARICVGGRNAYPPSQLPPGAQETTGAAYINGNNQRKDLVICDGGGILGVHPRSIYHLFRNVPAFQLVFGPLQRNPVGADPDDLVVTAPGFDPQRGTARQRVRHTEVDNGIRAFANAVAFVLTQETSHAMGLTPPGRLDRAGLLGGAYFGHSTDWHFDDGMGSFLSGNNSTPAPATAANLALIWDHFQSGRAHFTPLEWAYLRERVVNQ